MVNTPLEQRYAERRVADPKTLNDPDEVVHLSRRQLYALLTGENMDNYWLRDPVFLDRVSAGEERVISDAVSGFIFTEDSYYEEVISKIRSILAETGIHGIKKRLRMETNKLIQLLYVDQRFSPPSVAFG